MKNLNYQTGKTGESLAREYLIKNGYQILTTNFKNRFGEIDIIASKNKTIIFVEVKLKIGDKTGTPEEMLYPYKIAKIRQMGEFFLQKNPKLINNYPQQRIDAICIVLKPDGSSKRITHWKNIEI